MTVTDPRLDPDRMMFEGVNTDSKPVFTVSEMAKFFFAKTNHWIRWLESKGKMAVVVDETKSCKACKNTRVTTKINSKGKTEVNGACPVCTRPVGTRRKPEMNGRIYTLADIEEIAHALAANGSISGTDLRHTLLLLRVQGEMNEYL